MATTCERLPDSSTGEVPWGGAHVRAHTVTLLQCISRIARTRWLPSVPQFLGHNIPIYEEGALITAVTAVMQECCRKFPPIIFWEIRGGHTFKVMEKKRFAIASQALFLSDLEGVIHSWFTQQPPYIWFWTFTRFVLPFCVVSWTSYHFPLICRLCITCGTVEL